MSEDHVGNDSVVRRTFWYLKKSRVLCEPTLKAEVVGTGCARPQRVWLPWLKEPPARHRNFVRGEAVTSVGGGQLRRVAQTPLPVWLWEVAVPRTLAAAPLPGLCRPPLCPRR